MAGIQIPRDLAEAFDMVGLHTTAIELGLEEELKRDALDVVGYGSREVLAFIADISQYRSASLEALLLCGDEELSEMAYEHAITAASQYLCNAFEKRVRAQREQTSQRGIDFRPTSEALEAWATARGISDQLDRNLTAFAPLHEWYRYTDLSSYWQQSVRTFLLNAEPSEVEEQLREEIWHGLLIESRQIADALTQEIELTERELPPEPVARKLIETLQQIRETIRETVSPRPLKEVNFTKVEIIDTIPVQLTFQERHREPGKYAFGRNYNVLLPVGLEDNVSVAARCDSCDDSCQHTLAAIDYTLDLLFDTLDENEKRARLLELAGRAPWERTLVAIDQVLASASEQKEHTDVCVWWCIDRTRDRVVPFVQKRGVKGKLLTPKRVAPAKVTEAALAHESDRTILAMVRAHQAFQGEYLARDELYFSIIDGLIDHPRVIVDEVVDERWAIQVAPIEIMAVDVDGGYTLRPNIAGRPLPESMSYPIVERYRNGVKQIVRFDEPERLCTITQLDETVVEIIASLDRLESTIPRNEQQALLDRFVKIAPHVPVRIPESAQDHEVPAETKIVLLLTPLEKNKGLEIRVRIRPIPGGMLFVPGVGPLEAVAATPEREIVFARRDHEAEVAFAKRALAPYFDLDLSRPAQTIFELDAAIDLIERLHEQNEIDCEWPNWERPTTVSTKSLSVEINRNADWFGLKGKAKIDNHRVSLAVLLDAIRGKKKYIPLEGGQFLALEETMRQQLEKVEPYTFQRKDALEISPGAIGAVQALAPLAGEYHAAEDWADLSDRMKSAQEVNPEVPSSLQVKLRDYQVAGHTWLSRLAAWGAGGILADDMGLGKTLQALGLLVDRGPKGPQLVVAPTSVCFNWHREMQRFSPTLQPVPYSGPNRQTLLGGLGANDVLITSYALFQRDIDALAETDFETLVIDEAQAIKNPNTKRSRAFRRIEADWTVALTGTPVENHLGDLWAIFRIVFPGLLGSWELFREHYVIPIERHHNREASRALAELIRPFVLRRTKEQVAKELPPRTEITVDVALSTKERALYDDARLSALAHLMELKASLPKEQKRFQVLAALTRLRLICCHPRLYDENSTLSSAKLEQAMHIINEVCATNRRALVFSQFTRYLSLLKEQLEEARIPYLYLDGSTPANKRGGLIDAFQDGTTPLFLISLKAGGTGLNLTAADTVLHLDPWWNPAVEDQATDRTHRIGQRKPVTVYRLATNGTIEQEILKIHDKKRGLSADVLEGADQSGKLSSEELISLIQQGAETPLFARDEEAEEEPEEAPTPVRDRGSTDLLAALHEHFEQAVEEDRISKSTARTYERIGKRVVQLTLEDSDESTLEARYEEAIEAGRFPKSDRKIFRSALKQISPLL